MQKDIVVFRAHRDGDVVALFPFIEASPGCCTSYAHVGQHGAAHYAYCVGKTRPARPSEWRDLAAELRRIGYRLDVRRRLPSRKMTAAPGA